MSSKTDTWRTLEVEHDARGIVWLRLNRPDKRNALSAQLIAELTDFAQTVGASKTTRAVVLSGHGKVFCAGGDLAWMHAQIKADRATRIVEATKLAAMLQALNTMAAPLIGAIHGGAYGGGVGLCCICDSTVACDDTVFALTETKLGLIPATISPYVIARLGEGKARQVFMSARTFGAAEAMNLGVVSSVVPKAEMAAQIERELEPYLHVAPAAVGAAKALARALGPRIDASVIEDSIRRLADIWETEEALAGIDAFLNRRQPPWSSAED